MSKKILIVLLVGIGGIILFIFGYVLYYHMMYVYLQGTQTPQTNTISLLTNTSTTPPVQNIKLEEPTTTEANSPQIYQDTDLGIRFEYDPIAWEETPLREGNTITLKGSALVNPTVGSYYTDHLVIESTTQTFEEFRDSIKGKYKITETNPVVVDGKEVTHIWYITSEDLKSERVSAFIPGNPNSIVVTFYDTKRHHLAIIKTFHVLEEYELKSAKEEKRIAEYNRTQLDPCKQLPMSSEIGVDYYPVDPKYGDLGFVGQIFTAAPCGQERLQKVFGVNGDTYSLGAYLNLKAAPTSELLNTMTSLGFTCVEKNVTTSVCTQWELSDRNVKVKDILKLEPFYKEFSHTDCVNCG